MLDLSCFHTISCMNTEGTSLSLNSLFTTIFRLRRSVFSSDVACRFSTFFQILLSDISKSIIYTLIRANLSNRFWIVKNEFLYKCHTILFLAPGPYLKSQSLYQPPCVLKDVKKEGVQIYDMKRSQYQLKIKDCVNHLKMLCNTSH